ncbi:ABC transporter permease [Devosia pacifica]|uniref:ABC transporter permease n=1 Tax=Devosia pacifica TaxID=1335967 RepID=A0A918VUQ7_9HYPH|nr:sugar ABC transporter permease [Devosia pacifica]GHA25000.1 ABC transporter permease [Devosia pacifica]
MARTAPMGSRTQLVQQLWRDRYIYLFLLPSTALFALYTLWPIGVSIYFSMLDWSGFEQAGRFIGFANYKELANDRLFWNAFRNTVTFMVLAVPLRVGLALLLAILLNQALPFSRVFRTAIFLPVVTTAAILGVVMRFILDPTSGPVNLALLQSGILDQPVNFLGQSGVALYTAVGVWVWKWLGITLIYWLAALQTVPKDLYEAARIDGASGWQRIVYITLPLLTPFTIIITLITVVEATNVFDLMLTLTNGGPFYATEVIDIFVYRQAFASNTPRLGYASAASLFFGICVIALALLQLIILRRIRQKPAETE